MNIKGPKNAKNVIKNENKKVVKNLKSLKIVENVKSFKNNLKNIITKKLDLKKQNSPEFSLKNEIINIKNENSGQGAAEYILLFGGVIVIAIAALLIYRNYFETSSSGLNASNDVLEVRNSMNMT